LITNPEVFSSQKHLSRVKGMHDTAVLH
jgi:hypothetical protein